MAEFVSGVAELRAALTRAASKAPMVMAGAMFVEAEDIMRVSRERVPVDKSILKGSGTVLPPDVAGETVVVEFGYGGAASDYAVVQHERLDFRHTVGGPKFLENPTNEAANGLEGRLARRIGKRLES